MPTKKLSDFTSWDEDKISLRDHERLSAHAAAVAVAAERERIRRELLAVEALQGKYGVNLWMLCSTKNEHGEFHREIVPLRTMIDRICSAPASPDPLPALGLPAADKLALAQAFGAGQERERLLPLLARCLEYLGDRKGCGRLLSDLRRELPLPAQADRPAGKEQTEGEGARPEHDSAQLRDLRIRGQGVEEASDYHEEQGEQYGGHAQQADAESVPAVHACCGCSCHVCASGHAAGQHTAECWNRLAQESGMSARSGRRRR